jgi:hypothetical protein
MSFRLFIYYCALCGGAGAFLGWALGRWQVTGKGVFATGLIGLLVGLAISFALSLLDGLWNVPLRQVGAIGARVLTSVIIGSAGGLLGGIVGQALYNTWNISLVVVFGWTLTGLLIGGSLGVFELLAVLLRNQPPHGPIRKTLNGLIGGTAGGLLGGVLYTVMRGTLTERFSDKDTDRLWTPSSWGFVILGMCIGLLIALAQVILKEAWLKVEAGFRKGREQIISKPIITIGRAEDCDVGLFGDPQVDKHHCQIARRGNDYVLTDEGSSSGTFVNDERVNGSRFLRSGDLIRLGRCLLRFGERHKK